MVRFLDGPLAGVTLELARAPLLLRACVAADGAKDALDRLDDTPREGERLTVYRRVGEAGSVHLDYTDKRTGRRRGKWLAYAEYAVLPDAEQPADGVMRDTAAWRAWAARKAKGSAG